MIEAGRLGSMILWGPPGTGKTTLAEVIARYADAGDYRPEPQPVARHSTAGRA